MKPRPVLTVAAAAMGIALGLAYSWVIAPPSLSASAPQALRADFRDEYRLAIAAAYSATGNLSRARARLAVLGDDSPVQALTSQAQHMLASGQPFEQARKLALLAADLQTGTSSIVASAPPLGTVDVPSPSPIAVDTADLTSTAAVLTASPVSPSATLPPALTSTPISTPNYPFKLMAREDVCDPGMRPGLLKITVLDRSGRPRPGMEVAITWGQGEERFFTGLQPEISEGYADFLMQPGVIYSVRVARIGAPVSGVTAPACLGSGQTPAFIGALELVFQEP